VLKRTANSKVVGSENISIEVSKN